MTNFFLYLSIILAAKVATLAVVALARQRQRKESLNGRTPDSPTDFEPFYCLKADLKKENEGSYVCRMMFANQSGGSLITQGQARRQTLN